jgi:hypothetical protein
MFQPSDAAGGRVALFVLLVPVVISMFLLAMERLEREMLGTAPATADRNLDSPTSGAGRAGVTSGQGTAPARVLGAPADVGRMQPGDVLIAP